MLNIRYMKAAPTTYLLQYSGGKLRREGPGLSFFYYGPWTTIVAIPLASSDVPFVFNETTADFQQIAVQGQLSYRVADPRRLSQMLDFTIDGKSRFIADDYQKLPERLVRQAQVFTKTEVSRMDLRAALAASEAVSRSVSQALKESPVAQALGLEILDLAVLSIRATPEMAKALEAGAREELNRRSDEAIYARRNAAVEQERIIKENELNTQLAVDEKERQINERKMQAEIALERQRQALIDQRVENERKDADSRAYALEASLKPVRDLDWRTLTALGSRNGDPRATIAMAFQQLAENAQKIGELNVTPDLLKSLLTPPVK